MNLAAFRCDKYIIQYAAGIGIGSRLEYYTGEF